MKSITTLLAAGALLTPAGVFHLHAQDSDKATVTIPKEQYQKLLTEHQKLLEEMNEMKAFKARFEEQMKKPAASQADTDQALDEVEKEIKKVKAMAKDSYPGSTKFLLGGYATAGFTAENHAGGNKFSATFNPILLWKMSDRLLFEGEFEVELAGHDATPVLEMAQISYVLNDFMTLGAGKFLSPINYFVERQHMGWVNKLPDKPLAVYDGLLPESNVGAQVRGGVPLGLGSSKVGYSVYLANAPQLQTASGPDVDVHDVGRLDWNDFDNVGHRVAVGGRIGLIPLPQFELGYGMQWADVTPRDLGVSTVHSLLQSVDASYIQELKPLGGTVNLKAQWAWTHIDGFPYAPADVPTPFKNNREGGYLQAAYRPTLAAYSVLKNFEAVFRYDLLNQKNTPSAVDERRKTVGLDYWLSPSSLFKVAYIFDRQGGPSADPHDAVMVQFVTGF